MPESSFRRYRTNDPEHPFVLFGPSGYLEQWTVLLNAACEGVAGISHANIARWTLDMLRHCWKSAEGRKLIALEAKRSEAQPVLRGFFSSRGYTLAFAGNEGGFLLTRADGKLSDVDQGIRVLTRLLDLAWPLYRRLKKSPMRVGKRHRGYREARARTIARAAGASRSANRQTAPRRPPGSGFFRVKFGEGGKWGGPKPIPPNFRDTLAQAAIDDDWPEALKVGQVIEAASGSRGFEAKDRVFADWWDASRFGNEFDSPNKRSGGRRVKRLIINERRVRVVRGYVNGARLKLAPGKDMAYWRRVGARAEAGCEEARRELETTPILLSPRGDRPYSYRSKARYVQRSMQRRGISARGHAQRHEHTTERFDEIDAMPISEEAKILLLREHGRIKHWADFDAMYRVYAGKAVRRRQRRLEVAFQDARDQGQLAVQRRRDDELDIPQGDIVPGVPVPAIFADAAMQGMAPC